MADAARNGEAFSLNPNMRNLFEHGTKIDGEMSAAKFFLESVARQCVNCDVYGWNQVEDTDALLCCPHCNLLKYCSLDCQEEHWVKVHNKHCSSLASSVVPTYQHKEEECDQCVAVAAQGGPDAVADQLSPVYPCILKSLDGTRKSLLSHHPFSLKGDTEDRIERLVVLIKKLLVKMALSNHKVMETCSKEMFMLVTAMDFNRLMIWMLRKTKPCPEAAVFMKDTLELCNEGWKDLLRHSGRLTEDEYALSDDHFRIFDTCAILYNVLDYIDGPITMQRDFKDATTMFPEDYNMQPLLAKAQNSTFLATVDRLLDALEPQLIPYPEVVRIICNGEVKKCSICDRRVTVTEVCQFKKRLNRVACFFNTMNMGMVRCARPMCDFRQDQHPSRIEYQKWYPRISMAFVKYKENLCHFCFKLSSHGVVHRCGRCLTKVYCSKECQMQDWSLIHSQICKGKGVLRKLKGKAKERKEVGDSSMKECIERVEANHFENAVDGGYFDPRCFFQYERMLEDMKERL